MSAPHGLPSFRKRALSLSSLNVPRRLHLPIILLRLLSLIPAAIGFVRSSTRAWLHPEFDETGIYEIKSTPLVYCVAVLWCALAGYWSWIFTTSMLRRWLYHYELSNAMVRLVTLTVINWSVSAFISSYFGADQPIWKWMTLCFILLVCNVFKIVYATSPKHYNNKRPSATAAAMQENSLELNLKSTVVRVLVLPLSIVIIVTMFATLYQVNDLRSQAVVPVTVMPASAKQHPEMAESQIRVMVFILSAWTPKSIDKRKTFRETTMKLMPSNSDKISYFYRFILGQPPNDEVRRNIGPKIDAEIVTFGDLLLLPCSDKYEDLSKKVFGTMEWADQYQFDYLIKTDDDIFARWDTISDELIDLGRQHRYWRGLSYWNIPPIRDGQNKNSEFEYPLPVFPRYTAGALYILSRDVVHLIARGGPRTFVKNEDQNLGLWLFPYNINPIFDRRIQQIDVCEDDMIAKHFGDFGDPEAIGGTMYDMLDNLRQGRRMCTGFRTIFCGLCYPCQGKVNHWRDWNFDCDAEKGVTLLNLPKLTLLE